MMSKTNIFYTFILILLLTGFAFQVKESVVKYLQGKTTTAIEWKDEKELLLPAVSFCPGFKKRLKPVRKPGRELAMLSFWDTNDADPETPINETELTEWWHDLIFHPSEVFAFIRPPQDHEVSRPSKTEILSENFSAEHSEKSRLFATEHVSVKPVITNYGACYTLTFLKPVEAVKAVFLKLNMTGKSRVALYIHPPGHEIGLYGNYWPAYVGQEVLTRERNTLDIPLIKEVTSAKPGKYNRCEPDKTYSFTDCLMKFARKSYLNADCPRICRFPQSLYLTSDMSIPPCLTDRDTRCMMDHLFERIIENFETESITGCKRECDQDRYVFHSRQEAVAPYEEDAAFIFILYQTTVYSIFEEYVLYDENTIIAGVGGSLGLFLGLSCFQVVKKLTKCGKNAAKDHSCVKSEQQ